MIELTGYFVSVCLKFFILLTPFFVLSMFLSLTRGETEAQRRRTALHVTGAVMVGALMLYFFGNWMFTLLGITVDAFRVGGGALLFLSAVSLVRGDTPSATRSPGEDVAVVPLATPVAIGPATAGALLVMGAERHPLVMQLADCLALTVSVMVVGGMLLAAASIQRLLGDLRLSILSKLTGLCLAAMAAQMMMTGLLNAFASVTPK